MAAESIDSAAVVQATAAKAASLAASLMASRSGGRLAGSPILAAGNGVVEKAGWAGGYGKQTIIRHANGYETSYNHQSRIGNGIKPGVRVRQGQVIGFVGTTGLSTGAHLHYELIVNKRKVDPMRVRLPVGKVLKGEQLDAFLREKTRIDELLKEEDDSLKMASANAKLGG